MSNTNNVVRQINDLRQNLGEQAFRFSTFDTNVCKGMAILFMILHHAVGKYYNDVDLSWYSANANSTDLTSLLFLFLSTAGKVCVPLFTVLSGFGIAKSYSAFLGGRRHAGLWEDVGFVAGRYLKLYSIYLPIALLVSLKLLCGAMARGDVSHALWLLRHALFDLNMLHRTLLDGFTWYLDAMLVLLLLFPILRRCIARCPAVVLILTAIPWLDRLAIHSLHLNFDSVWSCLFPFSIGVCFQRKEILDRFKIDKMGTNNAMVPVAGLCASFALRLVFALPMDILFALSIIFFEVNVVASFEYLAKTLSFLGRHSANMWLLHVTVLGSLSGSMTYRFAMATLVTLVVSCLLEKAKIATGYNRLFMWARGRMSCLRAVA